MIDYHIHTHISDDCDTPMREMAAAAIAKGIKEICYTEHIDIDFPGVPPERSIVDFDAYDAAIAQTRAEFPQLIIKQGIEVGMEINHLNKIRPILEGHDLDFIIGSLHLVDGDDPYDPSFWDKYEHNAAYTRYTELLISTAACEVYDVLGHIGYIGKFCPHQDRMYRYSDYAQPIDELLKIVITKGKGIEVNTGGLRMTPSTMPETNILRRYFELGGEILTLGSDAHITEHVGLAAKQTLAQLKDIGFKYICAFDAHRPRFVPIP